MHINDLAQEISYHQTVDEKGMAQFDPTVLIPLLIPVIQTIINQCFPPNPSPTPTPTPSNGVVTFNTPSYSFLKSVGNFWSLAGAIRRMRLWSMIKNQVESDKQSVVYETFVNYCRDLSVEDYTSLVGKLTS